MIVRISIEVSCSMITWHFCTFSSLCWQHGFVHPMRRDRYVSCQLRSSSIFAAKVWYSKLWYASLWWVAAVYLLPDLSADHQLSAKLHTDEIYLLQPIQTNKGRVSSIEHSVQAAVKHLWSVIIWSLQEVYEQSWHLMFLHHLPNFMSTNY